MVKQKNPGINKSGMRSKEKDIAVAEGSLQARAPGWVAPGGASQQYDINRLSRERSEGLQGGSGRSRQGERGALNQQSGWSSRQQAERMRARAEEARLGTSQQSGNPGSPTEPASDYAGKKGDSGGGNR